VTGVEYDGEEVEGYDGYSTTGKWSEHKFHIIGGEPVYEGEEREETTESDDEEEDDDDDGWDRIAQDHDDDDGDVPVLEGEEMWASEAIDSYIDPDAEQWEGIPLSPWHDGSQQPEHPGRYQMFAEDASWPFPMWAEWTGKVWKDDGKKIRVKQWRGLSQPAD
jgi:hypothetical protein